MLNFCPRCGERVKQGNRFCSHCGHQLTKEGAEPKVRKEKISGSSAAIATVTVEENRVKNLCYASMAGFGALALISLFSNSGLGFLLGAAFGCAVYFLVLKKYNEGDYGTCAIAAMVVAIATGIIGLVVLSHSPVLGLVDILPAVPLFYVWRDVKDRQIDANVGSPGQGT